MVETEAGPNGFANHETGEVFVRVTMRIPLNYYKFTKEIATMKGVHFAEVVREFFRTTIENTPFFDGQFNTDHVSDEKPKIIEVFYCQCCANEIKETPRLVKFRDDVFRFCNECFLTEKYKDTLHRIAQTYEY